MIVLPDNLRTLLANIPIPRDLRQLPPNGVLQFVLFVTPKFLEILPDFSNAKQWKKFRSMVSERISALKIKDVYFSIYQRPELQIYFLSILRSSKDMMESVAETAEELGYADLMSQKLSEADPVRLAEFSEAMLNRILESFDDVYFDEAEDLMRDYWINIHPTLSSEERLEAEKEAQYYGCVFFSMIHNALSIVANRESISSLLVRALSDDKGSDDAMIKIVRVDNTFRQHPIFITRYLKACDEGDTDFLSKFNNLSPPVSGKIRYPGLYFLFSLLDDMGLLNTLTHPQLLDICDHAQLHKWEPRIEDAGNLGRLLKEYKCRRMIK